MSENVQIRYYSGYIRNYKKLCEELEIDPSLSRTERETEILEKAYAKWQLTMMEHLYGMFAFWLYDEKNDKIFALRDQFGTKPFYYYVTADNTLL